jgi:hypothetical protein
MRAFSLCYHDVFVHLHIPRRRQVSYMAIGLVGASVISGLGKLLPEGLQKRPFTSSASSLEDTAGNQKERQHNGMVPTCSN